MIRNSMKRLYLTMAAAGLVSLCVTACGKKPEETTAAQSTAAETVAESTAPAQTESAAETEAANETAVDLSKIKLPELTFTRENFPRMNGSTSCVPLGKTLASVLLGETEDEVSDLISFARTTQSFRDLMAGESDILIVGEPNAAVYDEMDAAGFEYDLEAIATDALIFVVNEENPVSDLSTEQIRDIYTGKITNWKEVGGNDAPIIPFQRNEGAGSQALMKKLVMKDTPMMDAASGYTASEMGELMAAVKSYDNSANAIGYSVYYYANDMRMSKGLKIISVDGVEPKADTIRSGKYPHLNAYYCVVPKSAEEGSPAREIYNWITGEDGQVLVASRGYVSVIDTGIQAEAASFGENLCTRMDGDLSTFRTGDYGCIYPYIGLTMYSNYGDGYAYRAGNMFGFFDETGRIICDPIYFNVEPAFSYHYEQGRQVAVGAYLVNAEEDVMESPYYEGEMISKSHFITADGSFISEPYQYITFQDDAILCVDAYEGQAFSVFDINGELLFDQDDFKKINGDYVKDTDTGNASFYSSQGILALNFSEESFYCDRSGKIISGPYRYTPPYSNGIALVRLMSEEEALVDLDGNVLYTSDARSIYRLRNGYIAEEYPDHITVKDTEGNLISEQYGTYVDSIKDGFSCSYDEDGTRITSYFDEKGNHLLTDEYGEYECISEKGILYRRIKEYDDDRADYEVLNLNTGKRIKIENVNYVRPFWTMEGVADPDILMVEAYDENDRNHYRIYDTNTLKPVHEGDGYASPIQDGLIGDWYIVCFDETNESYEIFEADMKKIGDSAQYGGMLNHMYVCDDDHSTSVYDPSGKLVFRYNCLSGDD